MPVQSLPFFVGTAVKISLVAGMLMSGCVAAAAVDDPPLRTARECTSRSGWPNFFAKCQKGGTVKVAYLGGSITEQAGWRVQSLALLRDRYPQTTFEEVFAAIGGTGSMLGVFRLEHDVLQYQPDLLLVEFAVNDGDAGNKCLPSMEGIVRNTWAALPACDIGFIYTLTEADFIMAPLRRGKLWNTPSAMELLADHYGIPSIFLGQEVVRLEKAGKLVIKAQKTPVKEVAGAGLNKASGIQANPDGKIPFAEDGVHPYLDTGHTLYAEAVQRSLPALRHASGKPAPHLSLPAPLVADCIKNVSFLDVGAAKREGDWTKLENPVEVFHCAAMGKFVPSVWQGKPGATLSFQFTGRRLMLYTLFGPGAGTIEITIDGKMSRQRCFDPWSSGWRLAPCFPASALDPQRVHTATIKVLPEAVDKKSILAAIGEQKAFADHPDAFNDTDLAIGGICIEGGTLVGQ